MSDDFSTDPFYVTAGVQRALGAASQWTDGAASEIGLAAALLGLLAEPECRGAQLLAARGVDTRAILDRWPTLRQQSEPSEIPPRLAPPLTRSLQRASDLLWEYPQPLMLATEHLLLGIVAGQCEVAHWLQQQGLDPAGLEAEVHRLAGHCPGPLPLDETESLPPLRPSAAETIPLPTAPAAETIAETSVGVLRILDAASNRAAEGLRVAEDYVRFVLDDPFLTERLRGMRAELATILQKLPAEARLAARESRSDVGPQVASEHKRADLAALVAANFSRAEQALRSLEEYCKLLDPAAAAALERLRYETYMLERAADVNRASRERLASVKLCALVGGTQTAGELEHLASELLSAGVTMLQLREKNLTDREILSRARRLVQQTRKAGALLIVNDRPDLAVLAHADGVHLGQDDLSVKDARAIVGPAALIGVSTHSQGDLRRAILDGANYVGVGPTFPSGTKHFDAFPGLDYVRAASAETKLPSLIIGGVSLDNLPQIIAAGGRRVALSGALAKAKHPGEAAQAFLRLLPGEA